ncbi:MAG: TadG family pilus assembly protein [Bacillota bacterium]
MNPSVGFSLRLHRRGFAAVYTVILLIALCGIVSLAVDMGRAQLAKTELQTAADAAVRAAAGGFDGGAAQARLDAAEVAAANRCNGRPVLLEPAADVEFGTWDPETKTFTAVSGFEEDSANAIRVTTRRIASRGTAIPLVFAPVVGVKSCDVQASAIAMMSTGGPASPAFGGIEGIELKNNVVVARYRSSNGPPGEGNLWNKGSLGSNGEIDLNNNATLKGSAILGPGGSLSLGQNATTTGGSQRLASALDYPPVDAGSAVAVNDNGRIGKTSKRRSPLSGKDFTLDKESILIGPGTYYFTSMNVGVNSILVFTGPVTIYVAGPIVVDKAEIFTAGDNPDNLRIRQIGSGGISLSNTVSLTADIYAPQSTLTMENNVTIAGAAICRRIVGDNGIMLYYDEQLKTSSGGGGGARQISLVN